MRIVIDLQAAQGTNRLRGIGRFSISLARAMIEQGNGHEYIIALNGAFRETIGSIRAEFNDILNQDNIRVWEGPPAANFIESNNAWTRRSAELIRENFLLSLKPDVVHVSSLFEGLVDDVVTSIGTSAAKFPVAVTLYDLIPLIFSDHYLRDPRIDNHYQDKISHLRRADLLLAISESARTDAIEHLGMHESKVTNISAAIDPKFKPIELTPAVMESLRARLRLPQPFVLYTGGIDFRKNIEGLIRAFSLLPLFLRSNYQLAIVCAIQEQERERLTQFAEQCGLDARQVVFTGYVTDDDLVSLYNICDLFCFPSLYEGFGLPVLEAMACGAAVITSNTSSLPEIVGRTDNVFPPDDVAIAKAITAVLSDDAFRNELRRHGLVQAKHFSWTRTARAALEAIEDLVARHVGPSSAMSHETTRPRLLYVSPLPPQQTGIADYSAELLVELTSYYDIVAIVPDPSEVAQSTFDFEVRSVRWFYDNVSWDSRILYHFGNSSFHSHMFEMLRLHPGTVVLHDFFLSGIIAHRQFHEGEHEVFSRALMASHGYDGVRELFKGKDNSAIWNYPANFEVVQQASGVIVHSEYPRHLAEHFYNDRIATDWITIPLLRTPVDRVDKARSREKLGVRADEFIVCCFGGLGMIKSNDRLLSAWLTTRMSESSSCRLVFVGNLSDGAFADQMRGTISSSERNEQIQITGFVSTEEYQNWLCCADVAVQLRKMTRGETSAAALDCLNFGIPTIVNAHGSLDDFPADCVLKLRDDFDDSELAVALDFLWENDASRRTLSQKGLDLARQNHSPAKIVLQYQDAIEKFQHAKITGRSGLIHEIAQIDDPAISTQRLEYIAQAFAISMPVAVPKPRIFIDISELIQRDAGSGIQRVVRSILRCLLSNPPDGYRIEPVYATYHMPYHFAKAFTLAFLNCPPGALPDEPIDPRAGDIFLGLDLQPHIIPIHDEYFDRMRARGTKVYFVIYDLLCIRYPKFFFPGAEDGMRRWLDVVSRADGAISISQNVADDMYSYLQETRRQGSLPFKLGYFHLGTEIGTAEDVPHANDEVDPALLANGVNILMVGTIEPRKAHQQALDAFERLWSANVAVNLIIAGKPGWMTEELLQSLSRHSQRGHRLFLFFQANDARLKSLYALADGLLLASEAEGFGLPLVEAARYGVPVLARDLPVFREVAGSHATYFKGTDATCLATALQDWIFKLENGSAIQPTDIPLKTWAESTEELLGVVVSNKWYKSYSS